MMLVGVFVTECQFSVSGTDSYPSFLIQSGDFVVDQAFDVRLRNRALQKFKVEVCMVLHCYLLCHG